MSRCMLLMPLIFYRQRMYIFKTFLGLRCISFFFFLARCIGWELSLMQQMPGLCDGHPTRNSTVRGSSRAVLVIFTVELLESLAQSLRGTLLCHETFRKKKSFTKCSLRLCTICCCCFSFIFLNISVFKKTFLLVSTAFAPAHTAQTIIEKKKTLPEYYCMFC